MNQQAMRALRFDETYRVSHDETAAALFARLPHGRGYADKLADCLATGYLVAIAESMCIRAMQHHVDPATEVVVGRDVAIKHHQPSVPGDLLQMSGEVEHVGERSVTFLFRAADVHGLVCEARIVLVAARRTDVELRIATKRHAAPLRDEPLDKAA